MSNSTLVDHIHLSPNCTKPRNNRIDAIVIHHMAGKLTVEQCGNIFASAARKASSNYGIDSNGRIGMYVEEKNRSWATSNRYIDHRAVTIEVANSSAGGDWPVSKQALEALIRLCADICKRNKIEKLIYTGDKRGNLHMHKWYAATGCPGPYLGSKFPYIAEEVNKILEAKESDLATKPPKTMDFSETVKLGQAHAKNFADPDLVADGLAGPKTQLAKAKVLQMALCKEYGVSIAIDGIWGQKSETAFNQAGIRLSKTSYVTTALVILLLLNNVKVAWKENPAYFDIELEEALKKYQEEHGITVDGIAGYKTFKSLIQ